MNKMNGEDKRGLRVLMFGLDGAGKTQILYRLKTGRTVRTVPTIGFNVETIELNDMDLSIWDVGGKNIIRVLWRHYCPNTHGVIFIVDSTDRERINEAKEELMKILGENELKDAVLLILANKQDMPNAMSTAEITEKLNMNSVINHKWYIQRTCAINGNGLGKGIQWFSSQLKNAIFSK